MTELVFLNRLIVSWFLLAVGVGILLAFFTAPYGRHARRGWGPALGNRLGWIIMEAPAPLVFFACFIIGEYNHTLTAWAFFLMWEAHYVPRSFIYPLGLRTNGKRIPLLIVGMGLVFNGFNGYMNGRYLFTFSGGYPDAWLADPRFLVGLALFVVGYVVNRRADGTLHRLSSRSKSGYAIPYGGLYRWISCPNYLGEVVQWFGWALATWSWVGLAFALWTAANLVPRAHSHHRWYREQFPDYPPQRKALLPGLW